MAEFARTELDSVLRRALELSAGERQEFLDDTCDPGSDLRQAVERMLEDCEADDLSLQPGGGASGPLWEALARDYTPAAFAFEPGERVGPYRVVRRLGRGGMATVYLAERADGHFEQAVALKVLDMSHNHDALAERFAQERRILARLEHPNIARLIDGGATRTGQPWFAMEVVHGEPIDLYCDRLRLSIDERLKLFIQVARAVQHAHQRLIVHRDLKPSNILVSADGKLKLLDFGIAKLLDAASLQDGAALTRAELHPMTPKYASPEQIRGEVLSVASDIYQLGFLLYELLTGNQPYSVDPRSAPAMARAICDEEPARPSFGISRQADDMPGVDQEAAAATRATTVGRLRRQLRGDLDNIVLMALRKQPERRYASANQLAEDLVRFLSHQPVVARPDTVRYRLAKFTRRNRVAVSAAALLVVASAVFAFRLVDERNNARAAALKANQVSDFMVDLFEAADPRQIVREQLTARELLDQGAARIRTELVDQEDVQAHLMQTIGRVYTALGLYEEAEALLVSAVEKNLALFGADHLDTAHARQLLGFLYYYRGDDAAARPLLEQALATKEKLLGAEHVELVSLLGRLFMLHGRQNDLETAERLFERSLRLAEQGHGPEDATVATQVNNFALLIRLSEPERAKRLFERSVQIYEKALGADHLRVAMGLANIAELRRMSGDTNGLEALYRRIGTILEDKVPGSIELAAGHIEYGLFLKDMDRDEEARILNERAAAIYKSSGHPHIAYPLGFLAELHTKVGEFEQARELHAEAISVRETHYGPDHPLVATSLKLLADTHLSAGELPAAADAIARALEICEKSLARNHTLTAGAWLTQGAVWTSMGRHADAEAAYRAGLAAYADGRPDDYPNVVEARGLLGESLVRLGQFAEAENLLLANYDISQANAGTDRLDYVQASERLVRLYEAWNQPIKALRYRLAPTEERTGALNADP